MRQLDELLDEILQVEEDHNGHVQAQPAEQNGHASAELLETEELQEIVAPDEPEVAEELLEVAEPQDLEELEDFEEFEETEDAEEEAGVDGPGGAAPRLAISEAWYPAVPAPTFEQQDQTRETVEEVAAETPAEQDAEDLDESSAPYADESSEIYGEQDAAEPVEIRPQPYYPAGPPQVIPPAYDPQTQESPHAERWSPPAQPVAEEGQSMEEAMADSWDGSFDLADEGWDAGAGADSWVPPAGEPRVQEASFAEAPTPPAPPELQAAPEVTRETPVEPEPEIVPEPFSDAFSVAQVPQSEAPSEPSVWLDAPVSVPEPAPSPAVAPAEVPAPTGVRAPARPRRGSRQERLARRRPLRVAVVAGLVLAVAAASLWTITVLQGGPAPRPAPPAAASGNQQVVVWTVWDETPGGPAFVSVMADGGGLDSVLLAIPSKTVVTVPGRNFEAVGDAASHGDPEIVAAAVENILGVKVDDATGMPLASLAPLVDRIGGIDVEDPEVFSVDNSRLNGQQTVDYLRAQATGSGEVGDDTRFIRWLEVSTAIVTKAHEQPAVLQEIPEELRAVFAAAGGGRTEVLDLPVEAIGAGLARPSGEDVARLVRQYFVSTAETDRVVRIVVMNGNGRPGVGQRVARLLVPSGFRLVSSGNAPKFNVETTRIVAGSEEFLDEAYLAQRLLGVGEVYIVDQASLLADMSIVVGKDFLQR